MGLQAQNIELQLHMSKIIEVGPLPTEASIAKVRQVFSPFSTHRIALHDGKAYVQFSDAAQLEALSMKYDDDSIQELGNAKINPLPEDFQWTFDTNEEKQSKQLKTADFVLSQKKQQPKPEKLNPRFVVIADCNQDLADQISESELRTKLFKKYKIGRIIKHKRDLYVQFLDQNQVEILQSDFPELKVKQLGSNANITPTDPNFSYDLVKTQVEIYQREKRKSKEKQELQRQQKIKRESIQMQEIKQRILNEQPKSQIRPASREPEWSIRPEGERQYISQGLSNKASLFWAAVVAIWGVYVIFM